LRKQRDEKLDDKLLKSDVQLERALDELQYVKDQFRSLQDDRKRDVEETADFIK